VKYNEIQPHCTVRDPVKRAGQVGATPWFRTWFSVDPQPASISPTVNISIVFISALLLIVAGSLPPRNQKRF
jgi:hypothetical protein